MQNIHRYFLYLALLFIVILTYDAIVSYRFADGFGIGVGSLVLTLNTILLAQLHVRLPLAAAHHRRPQGRGLEERAAARLLRLRVRRLNRKHQLLAWMSLFWVGFADLYVRLCSMGIWTDFRIL